MGSVISILAAPFLVEWYIDIYINTYGWDSTYQDIILKFNMYLKRLINGAGFETFSGIIVTIGLTLLLYHFFADLAEKAAEKQLSLLILGKSFCIIFLAVFAIFHTKEIFIFMMRMVESLNEMINGTIGMASGQTKVNRFLGNEIVQTLLANSVMYHFSIWAMLGYSLTAFLIMLVNLGVKAYIMYYSATRILQLFVYYIYAPIGISDIFENGPGGTINTNSSGFRYLKTMFALMLQLVVITVIIQTHSLISAEINVAYFESHQDDSLTAGKDPNTEEGKEDMPSALAAEKAKMYPLANFEYTDHSAPVRDLIVDGVNKISEGLKKLSDSLGDESEESNPDTGQTVEQLKDDEIYPITKLVSLGGTNVKDDKAEEIIKEIKSGDKRYRMTIESTEFFFNWCTGSDGGKITLFALLMILKVLMVSGSAKLCNSIVGVSV